MHDHTLVKSLQTRRAAALAAVYDAYAKPLYGYCCLLLGDRTAAEAALRDTFLAAELRIDELGDAARLKPWLFAIARGEATRRRTAGYPNHTGESIAGDPHREPPASGNERNSDVRAAGRRRKRDGGGALPSTPNTMAPRSMAEIAVAALDPAQREVLELAERYGLAEADVAAVLELPVRRAHALLTRARHRLRRSLSAVILARTGREHCRRLAALTAAGGRLDAARLRRVGRHAGRCRKCGRRGFHRASAAKVLTMLPSAELPAGLRWQILSSYSDPALIGYRLHVARRMGAFSPAGFPLSGRRRRRTGRRRAAAAAVTCLLVAVGAVLAASRPSPDEPTPYNPSALLPDGGARLAWPYLPPPCGDGRPTREPSSQPHSEQPEVPRSAPGPVLARPVLTSPIAAAAEVARARGDRLGMFTATATEGRHPQRPGSSPTGSPGGSPPGGPSDPPSGSPSGQPSWAPSGPPSPSATGGPAQPPEGPPSGSPPEDPTSGSPPEGPPSGSPS